MIVESLIFLTLGLTVDSKLINVDKVEADISPKYWQSILGDICQLPSFPRATGDPTRYLECVRQNLSEDRADLGIWTLRECVKGFQFVAAARRCKSLRSIKRQEIMCSSRSSSDYDFCPNEAADEFKIKEIKMGPRRCSCPDGSSDCLCARPEILEPVKIARKIRTTEISIDAGGITPSLRFQSYQTNPRCVCTGQFQDSNCCQSQMTTLRGNNQQFSRFTQRPPAPDNLPPQQPFQQQIRDGNMQFDQSYPQNSLPRPIPLDRNYMSNSLNRQSEDQWICRECQSRLNQRLSTSDNFPQQTRDRNVQQEQLNFQNGPEDQRRQQFGSDNFDGQVTRPGPNNFESQDFGGRSQQLDRNSQSSSQSNQQQYDRNSPNFQNQPQQFGQNNQGQSQSNQQQFDRNSPNFQNGPQQYDRNSPNFQNQLQQLDKNSQSGSQSNQQQYDRNSPNFQNRPQQYDRNSPNFQQGPQQFGPNNQGQSQSNQQEYDRNSPNFQQGPQQFDRNSPNFQNGPQQFDRNSPNFQNRPQQYDRNSPNFQQGPQKFGPNNQGISQSNQQQYDRNSPNFQQGPFIKKVMDIQIEVDNQKKQLRNENSSANCQFTTTQQQYCPRQDQQAIIQPQPCLLVQGSAQNARYQGICSWMLDPLAADPESRSHFLQCQPAPNNLFCGRWQRMPCAPTTMFNVESQVCVFDTYGNPGPAPLPTPAPPNNFQPNNRNAFPTLLNSNCNNGDFQMCRGGVQIGSCNPNYQCPGQSVCQISPQIGNLRPCTACCYYKSMLME